MYTHFSDGKKLKKNSKFIWFDFLTIKYVKVLLLKSSLVPNYSIIFFKYVFDDPTVRMLMYTHFSDGKKLKKNSKFIWFDFLTLK